MNRLYSKVSLRDGMQTVKDVLTYGLRRNDNGEQDGVWFSFGHLLYRDNPGLIVSLPYDDDLREKLHFDKYDWENKARLIVAHSDVPIEYLTIEMCPYGLVFHDSEFVRFRCVTKDGLSKINQITYERAKNWIKEYNYVIYEDVLRLVSGDIIDPKDKQLIEENLPNIEFRNLFDGLTESKMNRKKTIIRLTESDLHNIIRRSVMGCINEINNVYTQKYDDSDCPFFTKVFGNGFRICDMVKSDIADERIEYAEEHLPCIGEGKRRSVYDLGNYVLKITNGSHRYQTKNEFDFAAFGGIDLFPHIIYQSKDFSWSIIEKAHPLEDGMCKKILGIPLRSSDIDEPSLEGFQLWAETCGRQPSRQSQEKLDLLQNEDCTNVYRSLVKSNPWFKAFYKLENSQRGDLTFGTDLNPTGSDFRGENLGYVIRDGKPMVVLLDGGFTKPWDTRKLSAKFGEKSPGIPDNIED